MEDKKVMEEERLKLKPKKAQKVDNITNKHITGILPEDLNTS